VAFGATPIANLFPIVSLFLRNIVRRSLSFLAEKEYDIVVVGGGIFGICAAWDAALRGFSVALIEQNDFAHATSANCFKVAHGGIRYLQHGDLYRIRESSHERSALLRTAPHLVSPMPTVVPTYGRGFRSKGVLRAGTALYDLVTFDRNHGIADSGQLIPPARPMSRQECLQEFPGIESDGLTGGMLFYDGHMYNPPRLALCFLKSAVAAGADAANYLEATGFVRNGARVLGVDARDRLTGDRLRIRGRVVVNAAGPWAEGLLEPSRGLKLHSKLTFSRDAAIVVKRQLTEKYAVAVQGSTRDADALISRGNRHLFMVPWRNYTLIGVWHKVHHGDPEGFIVTEEEVQGFLDEFNKSYADGEPLSLKDVSFVNAGLILFGENGAEAANLSFGKRSLIIDHAKEHGVDGLITVVGVRYTTARGVGEKAIHLASQKLGQKAVKSKTATTPVYGGQIENFSRFSEQVTQQHPHNLPAEVVRSLLRNYGTAYNEVLRYADELPGLAGRLGESKVIKAEVVHAVRDEMAQKLSDVVFRRTDLGTGGHPGEEALRTCADLMAAQLEWGQSRLERELDEVRAVFPKFSAPKVESNQ
jgi:glycerol-3-phosphate dehydrogenase